VIKLAINQLQRQAEESDWDWAKQPLSKTSP
jgi:hypothetical protein